MLLFLVLHCWSQTNDGIAHVVKWGRKCASLGQRSVGRCA